MEKQIITFSANEQKLIKTGGINCYASNIVSYIEAHFDLGQNWSGYDSVRAVWSNDNNMTVISTVLDSNGICVVPFEVLKTKGVVKVNLVGSISVSDVLTDRLTSFPCEAVKVTAKAKIEGSETQPITPSQFEQFVAAVISEVEKVTGMTAQAETLPAGSQATARYENGILYLGIPQGIQGERGERGETGADGNGIASVVYNADYSLTLVFTNGERFTTPPIRGERGPAGQDGRDGTNGRDGADGVTPNLSIGTVETLEPTQDAYVTRRGTDDNPIFDFGIPKGDKGDTGEVTTEQLDEATIVQTLSDNEPYHFRATPKCGSRQLDTIVGGSVGWNQLYDKTYPTSGTVRGVTFTVNADGTITVNGTVDGTQDIYYQITEKMSLVNHKFLLMGCPPNGGKYTYRLYMDGHGAYDIGNGTIFAQTVADKGFYIYIDKTYNTAFNNVLFKPQVIDLTLALGSTIADYVYSLEQSTSGSGVAWLKRYFDLDSYHPYDSGSIQSVSGLSAHVVRDADDNIVGNYPLDNTLTLRGIPKLADGSLYYDGDVYESDGTVTRRFGIVASSDLTVGEYSAPRWKLTLPNNAPLHYPTGSDVAGNIVCSYPFAIIRKSGQSANTKWSLSYADTPTTNAFILTIDPDSITTLEQAQEWVANNPFVIVYELATPTSETATPYTNPQLSYDGGTEEYVSDCIVPIGHETEYPMTFSDTMPNADGTYTMSVTITNGKPVISWTDSRSLSMGRAKSATVETEAETEPSKTETDTKTEEAEAEEVKTEPSKTETDKTETR